MRGKLCGILSCVICLASFPSSLQAQHCGQERWAVKTGTDPDVGRVDLASPQNTTIASLIQRAAPKPLPATGRFAPVENTVYVVNASLREFKMEGGAHGDSDYHLVLADDTGNTMVAEIPLPDCVGAGSPFAEAIANARAKFDAQFSVTQGFQSADIPVQVTGVGFFDFFHNQAGAAPNVIELHPVLDIVFNPQAAGAPDFALSLSAPTATISQGGSYSTTIGANALNGFNNTVAYVASGLPAGVTSTISPAGTGRSTLTLTATSGATPGTFPLTVTGAGGGKSHSAALLLNVKPSPAPSSAPQQWEYRSITVASEQDLINQANSLGSQEWELVSVVRNGPNYVGFFKRLKRDF